MSSPIDGIGSYVGHAVGLVVQLTGSLASAAYHGTSEDFLRVATTLVILYVTFKIFKRVLGMIAYLLKLLLIIVSIGLLYSAYQIGYEKSLEVAKVYGLRTLDYSQKLFNQGRIYHGLFHKYVQHEALKAWNDVKQKL